MNFQNFTPCSSQLRLVAATSLMASSWVSAQDFNLEENSIDDTFENGGEIVVTATMTEQRLSDVPIRTELITSRDIDITNTAKLSDLIEYETGVMVETTCTNCNSPEIKMLGLQQRYLSILSDGNASFSGLAGVYGIEQLPTGILERVEIVKGGASALYGSNAVAGVVNMIPRAPERESYTFEVNANWMDGEASSDRPNTDTNFIIEGYDSKKNLGIIAYGIQSYVEAQDLNGDQFTEISRRDLLGGGFRTVWTPQEDLSLSLDYLYTQEDRRGGEDDEALDLPGNQTMLTEDLDNKRHVGSLTLKHHLSDELNYQASLSLASTKRESYYGGIGALGYAAPGSAGHDAAVINRLAARFPTLNNQFTNPAGVFYSADWTESLGYGTTDNLLFNANTTINRSFGDQHLFSVGYQYRYETLDDVSGLGRNTEDTYINHGLFLQHDWNLSDDWDVIYGGRFDQHSKLDKTIFSPRISVQWYPDYTFQLRGSISTGFRAPELFDEELHISNVGGELEVVSLGEDLEEERSLSVSLSPNWRINSNWELESNLFYTQLEDTFFNDISTDDPSTAGVLESTKINAGTSRVYGCEINLLRQAGDFTTELGYVEQRSRYDEAQLLLGEDNNAVDNAIYSRDFERTPNRYAVLKTTYDREQLTAFIACKITGPMKVPHIILNDNTGDVEGNRLEETGYFFNLDVGTSYSWNLESNRQLTTQLGVRNLFNDFQDDLDSGTFRDPAYSYGPRFPRTIYAGAKFEF